MLIVGGKTELCSFDLIVPGCFFRVTASDCKVLDATSEMQQLRLKILQLEKELGRHRATQHRISKSGCRSRQPTSEPETGKKTDHIGHKAEDLQMR